VGLLLTIERTLFILLRLVNELLQRGAYYIFVSTNVGLCALIILLIQTFQRCNTVRNILLLARLDRHTII